MEVLAEPFLQFRPSITFIDQDNPLFVRDILPEKCSVPLLTKLWIKFENEPDAIGAAKPLINPIHAFKQECRLQNDEKGPAFEVSSRSFPPTEGLFHFLRYKELDGFVKCRIEPVFCDQPLHCHCERPQEARQSLWVSISYEIACLRATHRQASAVILPAMTA